MAALPPHLPFTPRRDDFVGRATDLRTLEAALGAAVSGSGRLVLVSGEPGIGKTRLCEEFSTRARRSGAAVLHGRCHGSGGGPPFGPWVGALTATARSMPAADLRASLDDAAAHVAQLVPVIRERLPEIPPPPDLDAAEDRCRLFGGVVRLLGHLARPRGLVVVLDDLHDADRPSLLLLEFVTRELATTAVLVLAAYRDAAVTPEHPLAATLSAIADVPGTERLALCGLSAAEVGRLVEQRAGFRAPASLASALHDKTEGNPLFVGEYLRALAAEGRLTPEGFAKAWSGKPPSRVQTVIARRLAPLSEACRSVLQTAAVIGREFRLDELERSVAASTSQSIGAGGPLEEALAAGVVATDPETTGGYRFTHALIRDALYQDLSAPERAKVHRQVGEAIERSGRAPERLAELAYHFCAAGGHEDLDQGVGYARLAAERAMALFAYEEAVRLYRLGLKALAGSASPLPRTECELLLALGDAQSGADDVAGAKTTLLRAAAIARQCGLRELSSIAALRYGTDSAEGERPAPDPTQTALLEESLRLWQGHDSPLHARLLARLSLALIFSPSQERSAALGTQAVEMAERVGDPEALAYALRARRIVARQPADAAGRLADANRIVEHARACGNRRLEFRARCWRVHDRLEIADAEGAAQEVDDCGRLAEELRQPAYRFQAAILRAAEPLRAGRWQEAERLVDEACAIRPDHARSHYASAVCHAVAGLFRGGTEAIADLFVAMVERYPNASVRAGCAYYLSRLGRNREAKRHFDVLAADGFAGIPNDVWVVALCYLAATCASLGDQEHATTLYELLAPCGSLAAIVVVIGAYCGPVAHYLAVLATMLGRWEAAERHFAHALETSRRLGARPWLAETQYERARMLLARGRKGDGERADRLLREVLATAREMDMPALLLRVQTLRQRGTTALDDRGERAVAGEPPTTAPPDAGQRSRVEGTVVFVERGDHWTISYAGRELQVKDSRAVRYLAYLVRHPRREIEALHLAAEISRISDAPEEEDASRAEDDRRERARSAVTKRIRAEIKRIAVLYPALGRHLAATISTGHVCRYDPGGKPVRRRSPSSGDS